MSGFWSFRESGAGSAAVARSAKGQRQLDLAVTQVLPVGVEFKSATLSTAHEDAHARFKMRAFPCAEEAGWIGGADCAPVKKLVRQGDRSSSQSASAEADDAVAVEEGGTNAHLVDRDEVIDAVQRKWWEALKADVRPGSLLPSASIAPAKVSTPDSETLDLVQDLLSRASVSALSKAAARSHDSALLRCEVRLSERKKQRTCLGRSPASDAQMISRKCSENTASCGFRSTVPRGPLLHTEQLARLRERRGSTTAVQHSEGGLGKSKTGDCSHHDQGGTAKGSIVASHLSSRPEGECSVEGETSTGTSTFAPLDAQGEVLLPSEVLQGVLRAHTKGFALSSTTATCVEAVRRREELLLLRHYFASWLAAAGQRHIQQCATSYHCFLVQCIDETLGSTASRVKEEGIHDHRRSVF
ncbi:hypothetical protein JIQ42_03372 [Leishmania sp. Namibia]|uniref:hypothetical protein n=1 Tax=Leishmania sp. Namibia TaxID=2802991 RepID=UPI001B659B3F|nr:hypothetical protein JIQ42_03372 [Leishmania sp. Namibia]